jgi:2-amino-4-hydroxy-6-hydroxymethyldihydropteridine diphosphokinase
MAALRRTSEPRLWRYVIALGSNQRHHRLALPVCAGGGCAGDGGGGAGRGEGRPGDRECACGAQLAPLCQWRGGGVQCFVASRCAGGVARDRGRVRAAACARWGTRVLDLDIVLWEGGVWRSGGRRPLCVPHVAFRDRGFVLGPAMALVPSWRDPVTGFTLSQLHGRLTRAIHAPRGAHPGGGIDRV